MKLGVFSDEISQDFRHAAAVAREIGAHGLELRSIWDTKAHDLPKKRLKEVHAILDEHGLECYDIAGQVFKCSLDSKKEVDEHYDILKRCCDAALELGSPNVRAFTFWRKPDVALDDVWPKIVEHITRAAELVAGAGLTLGIENEGSAYIGGGKLLGKLFGEVEPTNVGAIWDPANALFDPQAPEPVYPDGFEAIRDRLAFCHLKDGDGVIGRKGGNKYCAVGEGKAMLPELIARLKRDAWDGYLSLETHWRTDKALDEATVRSPNANISAGSAEASSRICMTNLHKMLEEA